VYCYKYKIAIEITTNKDRLELNKFNTPQTKVCMKVVAALSVICVHSVQHLYHDPVVQAGETCCAIDVTEYEKLEIKKNVLYSVYLLRFFALN